MTADLARLGARIREARDEVGYSLAKAARRAGITGAYLHAVENATVTGRTQKPSTPSVPVIRAIADALDADRAELLELAGYDDDADIDRARTARQTRASETVYASLAGWDRLDDHEKVIIQNLVDGLLEDR